MSGLLLVLAACLPPGATPRVDSRGDPLPAGAIARLGTVRLRMPFQVNCVAISPDGKTVLAGGPSDKVHAWDADTGRTRAVWPAGAGSALLLQYSRDGKLVVLVGANDVRLLDATTGEVKRVLPDRRRSDDPIHVALSPDKKTLVVRDHKDIAVWDLVTGAVRHRVANPNQDEVPPVVFLPDSKRIILPWTDGRLHVVDVASGKSVRCLEPSVPAARGRRRIDGLGLSADGKTLLYRLINEGVYRVLNLATGEATEVRPATPAPDNHARMGALALSPDGRFVYEALGRVVQVWGLASGKAIRQLTAPGSYVLHMSVSADGSRVAGAWNTALHVWDVGPGKQLHPGLGHASPVTHALFSPDGRHLFTSGRETMRHWDVSSGAELARVRLPRYGDRLSYLEASADGKSVEWIGPDRSRYRWRVGVDAEPECRGEPRPVPFQYVREAVSPDSKSLACIYSQDRKLRLIDLAGEKPQRELMAVGDAYDNSLAFSPNGRTLALGQRGGTLTLIDVAGGAEPRKLTPRPGGRKIDAPRVVFGSDGRSLLLYDGDLRLIEAHTGGERVLLPREGHGHDDLTALALSRDGRVAARGHGDGTAIAYDAWAGRELLRVRTGQGAVLCLAVSRDNRRLATGGTNTTALIYELPPLGGPPRVPRMSDDTAWRDLGDASADAAFRAMLHLLAAPEALPRLVRAKLKPPPPADPKRVAKLIDDLDSDTFAVREKATEELSRAGSSAREPLRRAARGLSAEARRRAEDLLDKLNAAADADRLRALRATEVLGRIGSPPAREALREMLKAGLGPMVEEAVKATLTRPGE